MTKTLFQAEIMNRSSSIEKCLSFKEYKCDPGHKLTAIFFVAHIEHIDWMILIPAVILVVANLFWINFDTIFASKEFWKIFVCSDHSVLEIKLNRWTFSLLEISIIASIFLFKEIFRPKYGLFLCCLHRIL